MEWRHLAEISEFPTMASLEEAAGAIADVLDARDQVGVSRMVGRSRSLHRYASGKIGTAIRKSVRESPLHPRSDIADLLAEALATSLRESSPRETSHHLVQASVDDIKICAAPFKSLRSVVNADCPGVTVEFEPLVLERLELRTGMVSVLAQDGRWPNPGVAYMSVLATSWWRWMSIALALSDDL